MRTVAVDTPGGVALRRRDPERQPVRFPRPGAARRAPLAGGADAAVAAARTGHRGRPRPRSDRAGRRGGGAARSRRGRTARRAPHARSSPGDPGVGGVLPRNSRPEAAPARSPLETPGSGLPPNGWGLAAAVWPEGSLPPTLAAPDAGDVPDTRAGAVAAILRGVMDSSGPATAAALAARLALPETRIEAALALLEAEGLVLQGRFRGSPAGDGPPEWCHRRVLARIHRLTLARLRRESAPVSAAAFLDFLAGWQHLTPETRLHGPNGVREVIAQLQGLEAPAAAWESRILPLRIAGYRRDWLDENCLSGEVVWGRTSVPEPSAGGSPARPTRAAPIGLLPPERPRPLAPAAGGGRGRPLLRGRQGARVAGARRRAVLRRTPGAVRVAARRARGRALGADRLRPGHRGRFRQPAGPDGPTATKRLRALPPAEGPLLAGPLGAPGRAQRGQGRTGGPRRSRAPAPPALGRGVPRTPEAGTDPVALAGPAARPAAVGDARRGGGRPVRLHLPRGTVRAARSGRAAPPRRPGRRRPGSAGEDRRRRSVEPLRHPGPGPADPRHLVRDPGSARRRLDPRRTNSPAARVHRKRGEPPHGRRTANPSGRIWPDSRKYGNMGP